MSQPAANAAGNALEALVLNAAMLSNPESKPDERALALSWLMHILGDIHQPRATTWRLGSTICINAGYFRATGRPVRHG